MFYFFGIYDRRKKIFFAWFLNLSDFIKWDHQPKSASGCQTNFLEFEEQKYLETKAAKVQKWLEISALTEITIILVKCALKRLTGFLKTNEVPLKEFKKYVKSIFINIYSSFLFFFDLLNFTLIWFGRLKNLNKTLFRHQIDRKIIEKFFITFFKTFEFAFFCCAMRVSIIEACWDSLDRLRLITWRLLL